MAGGCATLMYLCANERAWRKRMALLSRGRESDWQVAVDAGFGCGIHRIDTQHAAGLPSAFERIVLIRPAECTHRNTSKMLSSQS